MLIRTLPSIDVSLPAAGPQRKAIFIHFLSEIAHLEYCTFFLFHLIFTSLVTFS